MLPTIGVIYFVQKSPLVQNKIENVKWSELPCLTVPKKSRKKHNSYFKDSLKFY
jgi:hypothetical protein